MRRLLLAVALVVLAAAPARADDATQIAAALRTSPVYEAAGLDLVDVDGLKTELDSTDPQLYLVVLPAAAAATSAEATALAVGIGKALAERDDVVLVVTAAGRFGTGQGDLAGARGVDSGKALTEELKGLHSLKKDALTAFVLSFAERVSNQAATPAPGVVTGDAPVVTGGGSGTGWLVAGSVVALLGGVVAVLVLPRRLRRRAS